MSTNYDHVFVVVGDNSLRYTWEGGKSFQKTAGENKARSFLGLPGKQLDLVKSIYEKNKNITVLWGDKSKRENAHDDCKISGSTYDGI